MRKKGYTLSEVLVALAVVGFISAMTIPTIVSLAQAYRRPMFRSAYRMLEVGVAQLINDPAIYPGTRHLGEAKTINGNTTFCEHFAGMINTMEVNCGADATLDYSFIASNGMVWRGFEDMEAIADENDTIVISVDIDGNSKGENQVDSDIYEINIAGNGRLEIVSETAREYLKKSGIRN